jgi:uncharacterized protein YkwD
MPGMPAARAPALGLTVAATAISAVTVAAMAISGGPRRPLTFAGAILLPDDHRSATSEAAGQTTQPSRPAAPRTQARTSAAPSASVSTVEYPAPIATVIPIQNNSSSTRPPAAPPSSPVAGVPASHPSDRRETPQTGVPAPSGGGSSATALAQALFTALNDARQQAGLPPLSWSVGLQRSAAAHNQAMAAANQLASRVGDEPALGVRQANYGVLASYAAENLASTGTISLAGALATQQLMLAEQPPDDSRRQNLLSTEVSAVGIGVLLDPAHGRLWVTEDFALLSS